LEAAEPEVLFMTVHCILEIMAAIRLLEVLLQLVVVVDAAMELQVKMVDAAVVGQDKEAEPEAPVLKAATEDKEKHLIQMSVAAAAAERAAAEQAETCLAMVASDIPMTYVLVLVYIMQAAAEPEVWRCAELPVLAAAAMEELKV
jgi:hypothetical protein